jgi:hypothetical protein
MHGSRIHPRCPPRYLTVLQVDEVIVSVDGGDYSGWFFVHIDMFMQTKELGSDSVAIQELKAQKRARGGRTRTDEIDERCS